MRKIEFFRIKSVSDVITNSSTEVYAVKENNELKELVKRLPLLDVHMLSTEEDVKELVMGLYHFTLNETLDVLDDTVECNLLNEIRDYICCLDKTDEQIWAFVRDEYLSLIGYAFAYMSDHCYGDEAYEQLTEFKHFTMAHGGFCSRV